MQTWTILRCRSDELITSILSLKNTWGVYRPLKTLTTSWFLDIWLTDSRHCLIAVNFKAISLRKHCASFMLHSITKGGF